MSGEHAERAHEAQADLDARVREAALLSVYRMKREQPGRAWALRHWLARLTDAERDVIRSRSSQR